MRSFRSFFFIAILIALSRPAFAQDPDPPLKEAADAWLKFISIHNSPSLYLHLDKSIYTNFENIWFTAYMLDEGKDTAIDNTLYVILVDLALGKVVAADRFVMDKGLASGYLFINDTLCTGDYLLVAYTNAILQGHSQQIFRQPISIRSSVPPFTLTIKTIEGSGNDSTNILCRVKTDYGGLASGGTFIFKVIANNQPIISGTKIIDEFGEVHLSIPSIYSGVNQFLLQVEIRRNKLIRHIWQPFVIKVAQGFAKFYPEGGDLIDGHPSRVAVEIQNNDGKAISASGTLMEDDRVISDFKTDQYGLGLIQLLPNKNKHYKISWRKSNSIINIAGNFPTVKASGLSLSIRNGVIKDSLTLQLYGPNEGTDLYIMIHSGRGVLYVAKIQMNSRSALLSIPVGNCTGLATATIFSANGLPVAERTFLIEGKKINSEIITDSAVYHCRSKIKIHVKITDHLGQGVRSLFSFASVASGSLEQSTYVSIERFYMLDRWLGSDHAKLPPLDYFTDDTSFDKILLTRGWTKYNWQEASRDTTFHPLTLAAKDSLEVDQGKVYFQGRRLKEPVDIMVAGSSINVIRTDSAGNFRLPHAILVGPADSKVAVSVLAKRNQDLYNIIIFNKYDTINSILGSQYFVNFPLRKDSVEHDEKTDINLSTRAKTLQTAIVKGYPYLGEYKSNSCDDYVCMNNILNCVNHPYSSTRPINGAKYIYHDNIVTYRGTCINARPFISGIEGIHITKEFYVADYTKFNPADEDASTTVNWSPLTMTDSNGEAVIEFFTNDLTGKFLNIIEGVTESGVFSSKTYYKVVE